MPSLTKNGLIITDFQTFKSINRIDFVSSGQRVLGGSAPVNIPGSLARSSSFNSSSSLSTSPLSSLSQSLSQSLLSGAVSQQNQPSNMLAKQEHGLLGTPTSSSQNSLGKLIASDILLQLSRKALGLICQ